MLNIIRNFRARRKARKELLTQAENTLYNALKLTQHLIKGEIETTPDPLPDIVRRFKEGRQNFECSTPGSARCLAISKEISEIMKTCENKAIFTMLFNARDSFLRLAAKS